MIRIDQLFSVVLFEFLRINTSLIYSNFCESSLALRVTHSQWLTTVKMVLSFLMWFSLWLSYHDPCHLPIILKFDYVSISFHLISRVHHVQSVFIMSLSCHCQIPFLYPNSLLMVAVCAIHPLLVIEPLCFFSVLVLSIWFAPSQGFVFGTIAFHHPSIMVPNHHHHHHHHHPVHQQASCFSSSWSSSPFSSSWLSSSSSSSSSSAAASSSSSPLILETQAPEFGSSNDVTCSTHIFIYIYLLYIYIYLPPLNEDYRVSWA